ncbi:MAG: hypothetical protein H6737_23265 [Alphaproteobacteria bacterium]|nr:hypothetical protein [Alphaproteobacteria bacterium]
MGQEHPRVIAVSAGDSDDLAELGLTPADVDGFVRGLAVDVLRSGACIGYGGALRGHSFTESLIEVAKAERPAGPPAFVAYQAWPYYGFVSPAQRESLGEHVRFVMVDPAPGEGHPIPKGVLPVEPEDCWASARSLSRMRDRMATGGPDDFHDPALRGAEPVPRCRARIALGGKVEGWRGMVPGVAEEIACDLAYTGDDPPAVFLLGAFGGCVRAIVDAVLAPASERRARLAWLEPSFHAGDTAFAAMAAGADAAGDAEVLDARFAFVREQIELLADDLGRLRNGLGDAENRAIMTENAEAVGRRRLGRYVSP